MPSLGITPSPDTEKKREPSVRRTKPLTRKTPLKKTPLKKTLSVKVRNDTGRKNAKSQLWKLFSEYVRRRHADCCGIVRCCTCNDPFHWSHCHAGHFVRQARGDGVRFNLKNAHAQCHHCNIHLGGNPAAYLAFMIKKYSQVTVDVLIAKSNQAVHFQASDFIDQSIKIKKLLHSVREERACLRLEKQT